MNLKIWAGYSSISSFGLGSWILYDLRTGIAVTLMIFGLMCFLYTLFGSEDAP